MTSTVRTKVVPAFISDLLPIGGNLVAAAYSIVEEKLAQRAVAIALEEYEKMKISDAELGNKDEFAFKVHRYLLAARQHLARKNLRVLSRIMFSKTESGPMYADEFSYYARLLEQVSFEELHLVWALHQAQTNSTGAPATGQELWEKACTELVPKLFRDEDEMRSVAHSAQAHQLLVTHATIASTGFFVPAKKFADLVKMAAFEITDFQ